MLNEPIWISPEGVVQINRRLVGQTGEPHSLLDRGLLEGACERPKNRWAYSNDEDVVSLGCVLMFGLAKNHPFLQGNKRTGFTAMIGFLGANGFRLVMADQAEAADFIREVIEGKATEEAFIDALRPHVVPVFPLER